MEVAGPLDTTLEPQLENTHETPQSSRAEGLLFLHGLESMSHAGRLSWSDGLRAT